MKAIILCAGLGTRLKPWTEKHPKALVPIAGVPMLTRVCCRLVEQGFDEITVNVHHFSDQIIKFVNDNEFLSSHVMISDETDSLLDTGGGILHAERLLRSDQNPFLVHNVDILSNADLKELMEYHISSGRHVTLLVSPRISDRKLVFDSNLNLKGWINVKSGISRPSGLSVEASDRTLAFSGIYVMDTAVFDLMKSNGFEGSFPIMDFFLSGIPGLNIGGYVQEALEIIDIGKPDTLYRANLRFQ